MIWSGETLLACSGIRKKLKFITRFKKKPCEGFYAGKTLRRRGCLCQPEVTSRRDRGFRRTGVDHVRYGIRSQKPYQRSALSYYKPHALELLKGDKRTLANVCNKDLLDTRIDSVITRDSFKDCTSTGRVFRLLQRYVLPNWV